MTGRRSKIIAFGLFEGTAREDSLVATIVYNYTQYKKRFGHGEGSCIGEYKDFLLAQDEFLRNLSDEIPLRVVRVPYSEKQFNEWVEANPYWRGNPDAKAAWALSVAKDPDKLKGLTASQPIMPSVPYDESFTVSVYYMLALFSLRDETTAEILEKAIPVSCDTVFAPGVRSLFDKCASFKKVSEWRCEGISLLVGDRFINPGFDYDAALSDVKNVTNSIIQDVFTAYRRNQVPFEHGVLSIKNDHRLRMKDLEIGPKNAGVLFLPFVLVGSSLEVAYAEKLLETDINAEALCASKFGILADRLFKEGTVLQRRITYAAWHESLIKAGRLMREYMDDECGSRHTDSKARKAGKGGHLSRIK